MKRLVLKSWCLLAYIGYRMSSSRFQSLHALIRNAPTRPPDAAQRASAEQLSHAMDLACVLYFKRAFCLQRSAALTLLLRQHGWPAQMVIGAQLIPFQSHAWCEVGGVVVNDKPYTPELYQVLERC